MARSDLRLPTVMLTIGALLAAGVLSACGRKGALEAPPTVTTTGKPAPPSSQPDLNKPFVLDPLL